MMAYRPEGSLYFKEGDEADVYTTAEILMKQKYVVMLSKEENATILSYIHTYDAYEADRNQVAFMSLEMYEREMFDEVSDND